MKGHQYNDLHAQSCGGIAQDITLSNLPITTFFQGSNVSIRLMINIVIVVLQHNWILSTAMKGHFTIMRKICGMRFETTREEYMY
jgi:hypothetical protein